MAEESTHAEPLWQEQKGVSTVTWSRPGGPVYTLETEGPLRGQLTGHDTEDWSSVPRTLVPAVRDYKQHTLGEKPCPQLTQDACNPAGCFWERHRMSSGACRDLEDACNDQTPETWAVLQKAKNAIQNRGHVRDLQTRCNLDGLLASQWRHRLALGVVGAGAVYAAGAPVVAGAKVVYAAAAPVAGLAWEKAKKWVGAPSVDVVKTHVASMGKDAVATAMVKSGVSVEAANAAVDQAAAQLGVAVVSARIPYDANLPALSAFPL
jgi:hypothetical protein